MPEASPGGAAGVGSARRLRVGASSAVREFVRQPVNLALLVVLPPLVIVAYGSMMAAFPEMPFMESSPSTLGAVAGALFVAAFLPGVIGLFQVISAATADERLGLCGYSRVELFVARLLTVAAASLLAAGLSLAVLSLRVDVAAPAAAFGALLAAGLIYGLIGMLVGAVLPRELEGSLVLVFVVDVDEGLASGIMDVQSDVVKLFPLHYPHAVFESAVVEGTVATGEALAVGAYLLVLLAVALGVYATVTGNGGGLA